MISRNYILIFCLLIGYVFVAEAQVLNKSIPFYNSESPGAPRPIYHTVKKDADGNYYFLMDDWCVGTILGDIEVECIEWPIFINEWSHEYLVKVTPDLEVDTFVNVKGFPNAQFSDLVLCNDKIYLSYNNWLKARDSIHFVGDTLLTLSEGGVFVFDTDLNFERELLSLDKAVRNIACKNERLYVQAYLRDDKERNEHFTVINGDTLWNYNADTEYPAHRTAFVLSYDLSKDTIDHFWKFGSDGHGFLLEMKVDEQEDLILSMDATWATWFNFYQNDTIRDGIYWGDYLLKYRFDGELVYAREQSITISNMLFGEDGIYVERSYGTGSGLVYINGDTIVMCANPDIPQASKSILIKYDYDANVQWTYIVDGCSQGAEIMGFSEKDGIVSCSFALTDPDFEMQGQQYHLTGKYMALINLDSETGKVIEHYIHDIEYLTFSSGFLERQEGNTYRSIFKINDGDSYYGLPLGEPDRIMTYLADFTLDLINNTEEISRQDDELLVYPNPVSGNQPMVVKGISSNGSHEVRLYNMTGNLIYQNRLNVHEGALVFDWPQLQSGAYTLVVTNEQQRYHKLIINY